MKSSIRMIISKWKNKIIHQKYFHYVPSNFTVNDIYLVSYPKSGNTWMRFLIANAIKLHYNIDREVNFFSIQDIIPGISRTNSIGFFGPFGLTNLPRIITSHSEFNPYMGRVILIIRDPRDVIISHYLHSKKYNSIPGHWGLSDFIRSKSHGIKRWTDHMNSWTNISNYVSGQIVRIFKYEDMKTDTVKVLGQIVDLIGLKLTKDELKCAVSNSSIQNMGRSESKHMSSLLIESQETPFVRKGMVLHGQDMNEDDRKFVDNYCKDILNKFGYTK